MTRTTRRAALSILALAGVAAAMALAPRPGPAGADPLSTSAALTWSDDLFGTYTWNYAYTVAAPNYSEEVWVDPPSAWVLYDDWRLPTVEELVAAVTDADPETFGQTPNSGTRLFYWSSKKQGTSWAFAVEVYTDANGYPIPSLSGRIVKTPQRSALTVKCVRP